MVLHVRVTEPLMKFDAEFNTIDVNAKQFAADPLQIFEVPDTAFWRKLVMDGLLTLVPNQEPKHLEARDYEPEKTIPAQARENRRKRK